MTNSQNGWPVATRAQMDQADVFGATFPNGVLRGDVAEVLHYVARRFHLEVEALNPGWCWGWFVKKIEGGTSISNHASGTAIDLNAERHPLGAAGTFTTRQHATIDRILDSCEGVVRWGGHYAGRKDEMHFEIIGSRAQVAALAIKIRHLTPATEAPVATPAFEETFLVNQAWHDHMNDKLPVGTQEEYGVAVRQTALLVEQARTNTATLLAQVSLLLTAVNNLAAEVQALKDQA
jgi:hypothetical protein